MGNHQIKGQSQQTAIEAEEATMAAQGSWSSLPADLINRVADCLLATNDLDCYTDLRAVCHHWRHSTADPRSNAHDPRFLPSRWIMLDEHKASSTTITDGPFLFVNTATGRFLCRRLALLRDPGHAFVTSTTDGLLVLVGRDPPRAVSVLNPFTGSLIRFAAPLPSQRRPRQRLTADVRFGSTPTLVLVSVGRSWVYWAEPQSESFSVKKMYSRYPVSRLLQIAVPAGAENTFDQLLQSEDCHCYTVVTAGGDMLAVLKRYRAMDVFKIDSAGNVEERVKSIGSLALFLGVRCLVVDASCLPTVEANCAYFSTVEANSGDTFFCRRCIYRFNIGTYGNQEPELVSADYGPFTLTQLLSNYTVYIAGHELTWEGYFSYLNNEANIQDYVVDFEDYIDYVNDDESYDDVCYLYHLFDKDHLLRVML